MQEPQLPKEDLLQQLQEITAELEETSYWKATDTIRLELEKMSIVNRLNLTVSN